MTSVQENDDSVVVVDYDPARTTLFEREANTLKQLFAGTNLVVEHVGSTSIPGLGGKPIVDIMLGVASIEDVENRLDWLTEQGFAYMPEYEDNIPERRFFRKPATGVRQVHLHCVPTDSDFFREHIVFRDYLREHPDTALEYFQLKKKMAEEHRDNRDNYTNAKTEFIQSILRKAGNRSA